MRKLILALMLAASPAVTEARTYADAGGWSIIELDDGCVMQMEFEGPGSTNLSVNVPSKPGGSWIMITNADWSSVKGQNYTGIVMSLNGMDYNFPDALGTTFAAQKGFIVKADADFLDNFSKGQTLFVYRNKILADRLSLTGTTAALAQARWCATRLAADQRAAAEAEERRARKYSGIVADPFAADPTPAVPLPSAAPSGAALKNPHPPITRGGGYITNDDYPPSAMRDNVTGTTTMRIFVGADGRVTDCQGTGPSQVLSDTACRLYQRRARYTPATDADGNPIAAVIDAKWEWKIGDMR